ncbi:MAG: hypothetical protein A2V66_10775 [Ignavibacteria bacterium RBG_13_36_8]|nr:MAG: hypothetical protein A2V66_10775 [Ignavibacteria bacterium RBG_13_36_8]
MQLKIEPELKLFKKDKVYDLSEYAQGMTIQKTLNNPASAFNITLNPSLTTQGKFTLSAARMFNQLKKLIDLNDIIAGKLDRRSRHYSFLGFVSNPYEGLSTVNNQTSRSWVIDGSLVLPKLLIKDDIVACPQLATLPEITNDPILSKRAKFFAWTRGDIYFFNGLMYPNLSNFISRPAPDYVNQPTVPGPPNNYVNRPTELTKGTVFVNTPQKIIEWILNEAVATNTEIFIDKTAKSLFPGPKSGIKDIDSKPILNFQFLDGEFIYGEILTKFSGPLINYIYECLDKDFYEVFFDTVTGEDGLPYNNMIIRTKPFTNKDIDQSSFFTGWTNWEDLDTIKLNPEDILRINTGKSDYELKNFFKVNYNKVLVSRIMGEFGLNYPVLNINSIKKYGLRALNVNSTIVVDLSKLKEKHNKKLKTDDPETFSELLASGDEELISGLLEKRDKIKEWYAFPYYESGPIQTKLNEAISIGKRIELPEYEYYNPFDKKIYKGCKFYVNEVKHSFQWGQFAQTELNVTRGHPDGVVKAWFDHPDNKFTKTPLEIDLQKVLIKKMKRDPQAFYDKVYEINRNIFDQIEEIQSA